MHVYSEKDPVEINVQGQCTISCMCFLMEKTHACSQGFILEDCAALKVGFPLGNMQIIHKEQRKEIGAWRAKRKAREKPRFLVSIFEDCTESWLAVRAKALYNSYVFPPCMIIQ